MKNTILFMCISILSLSVSAQRVNEILFDFSSKYQTIHSFGASDCWRTQYIGKNWPVEKRNQIADLLFSSEVDQWGNPRGIGLSMWRFNIGSGSHEANDGGGVSSPWRRTECFLDKEGNWNWDKQEGQRWMLEAARKRGVKYSLGFSITAPYFMTKNGMARASEKTKHANIREDAYDDYAEFMVKVANKLKLDYLSPINEPQWEWVTPAQEGMQATNEEISRLIHLMDKDLVRTNSKTKIVFGEAADIRYLYRKSTDKPDRDNQIEEIFSKKGIHSIYGLPSVEKTVSGHSYWSTWPVDTMINTRIQLSSEMKSKLPSEYTYWQTEYCPMEQNQDNPNGGNLRDLGMKTALYVARVIHYDMTLANTSSWQWWTAFSEWNYKDGLIFIDDGNLTCGASNGSEAMIETCKTDGEFRTSKLLWALGNYSFFIRPGMYRISGNLCSTECGQNILSSAYVDNDKKKLVVVLINNSEVPQNITFKFDSASNRFNLDKYKVFETSERSDLQYRGVVGKNFVLPPNSVVTLVSL